MAQAKKAPKTRNKKTPKTRFYVVKTVRQTRSRVSDTLEDYSETYINRPIKSGQALVEDLKNDPRKTLAAWLEDGKDALSDLNKETRATVNDLLKDGKAFLTKAGKEPRQTLNEVLDEGKAKIEDLREETRSRVAELKADTRALLEGVGKDARLVVEEVVSGGRKTLDRIPGKQKLEKEVRSRIQNLPAQLNLPSKKDIEGLVRRVNRLNKQIAELQKSVAA